MSEWQQTDLIFDGPELTSSDHSRLTGQLSDIFNVMSDGSWRTLNEIEQATKHPQASISAQLRHLRKPRFGAYQVDRRRNSDEGTYYYRVRKGNQ